jgi:YggT family protein
MGYFASAIVLLIQMALSAYIYVLMLRFLLQKRGANYHNPVIQLIIRLTDCVVKPLKKLVPSFRGYDFAIVILVLVLELISVLLLQLFHIKSSSVLLSTTLLVIAEIGTKLVNIYFYAIIFQAIVSWMPNLYNNPASEILYLLCEPLLLRSRKMIPPVAGFDLSAIPVLIFLYVINMFVFGGIINACTNL